MTGVILKAQKGVAPGLPQDVQWDQTEFMHVMYKTTTTTSKIMQTCMWPRMDTGAHPCVRICETCRRHPFVWLAVHLQVWMYSPLYGQCRSINNATSAEVKEACLSGGGEFVWVGVRRQRETKRLRWWENSWDSYAMMGWKRKESEEKNNALTDIFPKLSL